MATGKDREDFDRSFDFFASQGDSQGIDKWTLDKKWGKNQEDETDIFEFSATSSLQLGDQDSHSFFPDDPFASPPTPKGPEVVRVAIHEQFAVLYDEVSVDPSCQVAGSIYVKSAADLSAPFCLVMRDLLDHVERVEAQDDICEDLSNKISRQGLHRSDRILRVTVPENSLPDQEIQIASYFCAPSLCPVPMLVKSRVEVSDNYSRAGFKIRANPTNEYNLTRLVIVLAVPPFVRGETVRMSRQGGVWDEMKRTISWSLDQLEPGEALEVQVQFELIEHGGERTPKFPVLVRADCPSIFSSVELTSDFTDGLSVPVKMKLNTSGRVLHRKV